MNISLLDTLKSFVDEQAGQRGYGTSSEYVRELIRVRIRNGNNCADCCWRCDIHTSSTGRRCMLIICETVHQITKLALKGEKPNQSSHASKANRDVEDGIA